VNRQHTHSEERPENAELEQIYELYYEDKPPARKQGAYYIEGQTNTQVFTMRKAQL
jgi:hypothetical protein